MIKGIGLQRMMHMMANDAYKKAQSAATEISALRSTLPSDIITIGSDFTYNNNIKTSNVSSIPQIKQLKTYPTTNITTAKSNSDRSFKDFLEATDHLPNKKMINIEKNLSNQWIQDKFLSLRQAEAAAQGATEGKLSTSEVVAIINDARLKFKELSAVKNKLVSFVLDILNTPN